MARGQSSANANPHKDGSRCHGLGCTSRSLIKAHIIPAGFARTLHHDGGHNLSITGDGARRARHQHGPFDRKILCAECDRKLGRLDDYALTFTQRRLPEPRTGRLGRIDNVACDRLAAFVTSVIWRASISHQRDFVAIDLGPHSDRARAVAFGHGETGFPVIAHRLTSPSLNVRHFCVSPQRRRLRDLNTYVFTVGGFQFHLIADSRPVPRLLQPLVINGQVDLISLGVPLEGTTEFQELRQIARSSRERPMI